MKEQGGADAFMAEKTIFPREEKAEVLFDKISK